MNTELEVAIKTVAVLALAEAAFLLFGEFIFGASAYLALAEAVSLVLAAQSFALAIMVLVLIRKDKRRDELDERDVGDWRDGI